MHLNHLSLRFKKSTELSYTRGVPQSRMNRNWKSSFNYDRKYRKEWEKKFPWVRAASDGSGQAYCQLCNCNLDTRIHALQRHNTTEKHLERTSKKAFKTFSATSTPQVISASAQIGGKLVEIASWPIEKNICYPKIGNGCNEENTSPQKKAKVWHQKAFTKKWMDDPELQGWLQPDADDNSVVFCVVCECKLKKIDKTVLMNHKYCSKHMKNLAAKNTTGISIEQIVDEGSDSSDEDNAPPKKKAKAWYQQAFRSEWMADPELKDWIHPDESNKYITFCRVCECKLKNSNKSALLNHKVSSKHLKNLAIKKRHANDRQRIKRGSDSSEEHDAPSETKAKAWYQQAFRSEWMTDPELKDWIQPDESDKYVIFCRVCECKLKNSNKSGLMSHKNSSKHMNNVTKKKICQVVHHMERELACDKMVNVAILTVSDRCSQGEAVDESGAKLQELVESGHLFPGKVMKYACVPDELLQIKETLLKWCDEEDVQLILTTGGTGFAKRDVTPEAVKKVIEREAPGLSTCMITESLKVTPLAMLSRPVCGCRGQTVIVTLPGSKKGSEECLRFIAPAIPHAVDLLLGDNSKTEITHKELHSQGVKCEQKQHSHSHHQPQQHSHSHHQPQQHSHGHHHQQHTHAHYHHGQIHHHHGPHHHHHHGHHHHHKDVENVESKADVAAVSRRPRKSPYPMTTVDVATETVFSHGEICHTKSVNMLDALSYVLAEDVFAKDPLPPFPASIKDGYAVVASDGPGIRRVGGESAAGCEPEESRVTSGMCIRVNTGAPVPSGADAVVQVEDTELEKEADEGRTESEIKILVAPVVGQDIRPIGCDIALGEKILTSGTVLGPSELGILAAVGVTYVSVIDKPVVAVLSTGNELQEPGEPLKSGHIRDSNKTTLLSLLRQYNFPVIDAGIAKDDPNTLLKALKDALSKADVLVTTGGVSMGEHDILRPVLQSDLEAEIHFAQVFMKPGKPTTFATCEFNGKKKLILGLPGNPVSAVVTSILYLIPLCRKMSGQTAYENTCIRVKLTSEIRLDPRPEYHRVTLRWMPGEDLPRAYSTGSQMSSRLLSMSSAQALLKLPQKSEARSALPEGSVVEALIIGM